MEQLIRQIHASPTRLVLALAGGGSRAVCELLDVPGASRTVLEAVVPYCEEALIRWLGGRPDQSCSNATARAMAMAGWLRARAYDPCSSPLAGIACTASLASDRPKRGPHRIHVAIQTVSFTATRSVELCKGHRSRRAEEELAARVVLDAVAEACGLTECVAVEFSADEPLKTRKTVAEKPWQDLLLDRVQAVRQGGPADRTTTPPLLLPGAFNPVHIGHRRMAEIAGRRLGQPVHWEIAILNPDKPPLDYMEMERRLSQFSPEHTVWLSRAATFEKKSELFPGTTFLVGTDTLRRIAAPRYYGDDPAACRAALKRIGERGCRFLVFGRDHGSGFENLSDLELPPELTPLCEAVPADQFREDVSSTEIRRAGEW